MGRGKQVVDVAPAPRIAVNRTEAARSLAMSVDYFTEHVQAHLRTVRVGNERRYLVADLERWAVEHAEPPMAAQVAA